MKNNNEPIDVLYTHTEEEFEPRFLMGDVEKELQVSHSRIKVWLDRYNIEDCIERTAKSNNRCFSMFEVNLLRKIKSFRDDDNFRGDQVEKEIADDVRKLREIKGKKENKEDKNISNEEETQLQVNNQPNIEQIANAIKESLLQDIAVLIKDNQVQMENNITEKMSKQLEIKKDEIIKELSISMSENKESIENTIQDTVKTSSDDIKTTLTNTESKLSTVINNGLESNLKRFKSYGDELEQKFSNRDEDNMAKLRESMEKQAEKNRLLEIEQREEKKKGFLDKISGIFGK